MAHGKWWEYLIPGWSGYRMTQDILDPVGTHGGQADKSYDQRVDAAKSNLDNIQKTDPGNYVSAYTDDINNATDQLNKLNKKGFSYDYTKDAAYNQYKNQYTRGAELASQDATARAAARSGGYGNSWGTSSGQTAYQSTMNGLSDVADSLYSQAYNEYATKKSDLSGKISALQQQDQLAQSAHNLRQQNYWNQLNNAESEYANAVSSKQQKEAENTNYWGNLMQVGASLLPYLLGAMGLI